MEINNLQLEIAYAKVIYLCKKLWIRKKIYEI
jgi:hypothetical protein